MTITRILVANRGEIARRVFRTARTMGISTAAIYSDGDRLAPFVSEADVAVSLDGVTAAQTYLDANKVLAAAAAVGADAVHPGYGFLSENAQFAQAVIDAGLTWIGPSPEAIAQMGDKLAAKETMAAAGVPTLASLRVSGDVPSEDELVAAGLVITGVPGASNASGAAEGPGASNAPGASEGPGAAEASGASEGPGASNASGAASTVAYPLMVKASAGGGGKGMRIVTDPAELASAIAAARREAASAFGDDTVFVERCLLAPRHVEIQVLGDMHGNLVHLFERECSIQRRHQKVIEEAPSTAVTSALRERLGQAALSAVGTLGYWSAGTVEFLLTGTGDAAEFFFLEVNTRLQVEHPVTEAITGLDLVREQIRIANGEPLGYGQDDLSISGWSVEARLYAENPSTGFLPGTGVLDVWVPAINTAPDAAIDTATQALAARFDSGVEQSSVVGTEFDPMLAKVISHAPTRSEAALSLARALERTRIGGVVTNRDFLVAALRSEEFLAGDTDTGFIERTGLAGRAGSAASEDQTQPTASETLTQAAVAVVLVSTARNHRDATSLAFMPTGYRNSSMPEQVLPLAHGDTDLSVSYKHHRDQTWDLSVGEHGTRTSARVVNLELQPRGQGTHAQRIDAGHIRADVDATLDAEIAGLRGTWHVSAVGDNWHVDGPLISATLTQLSRFPQADADAVEGGLTAPMPGKILLVNVAAGDVVSAGQVLVVMEAMKMEHQITTLVNGTISEVRATVDDQVDNGELLVVVEAT